MEGNDRRPMLARFVRAHPLARWWAALVAALPWLAWASLGTGAHAGPPPSADLAPIADALGAAGIGIRAEWPEGEVLTFVRPTTRYRDRQGDAEVLMTARILRRKGIRWLEIEAPSVFDLDAEEHAAAAMRALLAAPTRMTSMPTFSYDEDDGTVSTFRLIPLQGESLPSDQLATVVEGMVDSVDGAYAVVERVLRTGVVEWPLHGNGPTKGQVAFEITVSDQGASQSVSWAIHEPPAVHASAVISAGAFMRSYLDADDDRSTFAASAVDPSAIEAMVEPIVADLSAWSLPGAGGGGFLLLVAKDADASRRIRESFTRRPPHPGGRFHEVTVASRGLRVEIKP